MLTNETVNSSPKQRHWWSYVELTATLSSHPSRLETACSWIDANTERERKTSRPLIGRKCYLAMKNGFNLHPELWNGAELHRTAGLVGEPPNAGQTRLNSVIPGQGRLMVWFSWDRQAKWTGHWDRQVGGRGLVLLRL